MKVYYQKCQQMCTHTFSVCVKSQLPKKDCILLVFTGKFGCKDYLTPSSSAKCCFPHPPIKICTGPRSKTQELRMICYMKEILLKGKISG